MSVDPPLKLIGIGDDSRTITPGRGFDHFSTGVAAEAVSLVIPVITAIPRTKSIFAVIDRALMLTSVANRYCGKPVRDAPTIG